MKLKQKAEEILDRKIEIEEGFHISEIETKEQELKIRLPKELKAFYLTLGKNKLFAKGFQHFADINELFINDDKLVFLQENQSVIYWSVDLNDNQTVYQTTNQNFEQKATWFKEEFNLSEFIEMLLYFQCVMSDDNYHEHSKSKFKYFASLNTNEIEETEIKNFLDTLKNDFQNVVKGKELSIFHKKGAIILLLLNKSHIDTVFACCENEVYFDILIEKYKFSEL